MSLTWDTPSPGVVGNAVTDFRLSRGAEHYPAPADTLWWAALLELDGASLDDIQIATSGVFPGQIILPSAYSLQERANPALTFAVIFAQTPVLRHLNDEPARYGIADLHLGNQVPPQHLDPDAPPWSPDAAPIPVSEGTVLTAVVDDGIAIGHDVFRADLCRSRIDYCYILGVATRPFEAGRQSYGAALDCNNINTLLLRHTIDGLLDEPAFYREAGLIDFGNRDFSPAILRRSHGTHVMGLAAGYRMQEAPADRPILCASLPARVTEDVTGQTLLPALALALKVLGDRAAQYRVARKDGSLTETAPPVVFNLSYGNSDGPHNASGPVARLLDDIFAPNASQVRHMVIPSGNDNMLQLHAAVDFANSSHEELLLKVLPDDRTVSHVEIWIPHGRGGLDDPPVHVTLISPTGQKSAPAPLPEPSVQRLNDRQSRDVARLSLRRTRRAEFGWLYTININPTASLAPDAAIACSGKWGISLHLAETAQIAAPVQVWIQRDESLPGFGPLGRQPYFDNPCYRKFDAAGAPQAVDPPGDCPVRRTGSISGFTGGTRPLVIGGYTRSNGRMSDYSATALESGPFPDAAAPSDDSPALPGVISAGSACGAMVRISGTSVAAPLVTRLLVNRDPAGGGETAKAWLQAVAREDDPKARGPAPDAKRGGAGRLTLLAPFGAVRDA